MKLFVVCVRDRAIDSFGTPFFAQAHGQAVRSFSDEVNRDAVDNQLFKHPADYDLFALGTFDTDTGGFEVHAPRQLAIGKDVSLQKELPLRKEVRAVS